MFLCSVNMLNNLCEFSDISTPLMPLISCVALSASSGGQSGKDGLGSGSLSEFAKRALTEICRQDWVREKFLRNPEKLFTSDLLNDPILSYRQVELVISFVCRICSAIAILADFFPPVHGCGIVLVCNSVQ